MLKLSMYAPVKSSGPFVPKDLKLATPTHCSGMRGTRTDAASMMLLARAAIPTSIGCCTVPITHYYHLNPARSLIKHRKLSVPDAARKVHDVLNVFMCTGFDRETHQYIKKASPVRAGDYLEFFAEIDLLGALSACPARGLCNARAWRGMELPPIANRDLPAGERGAQRLDTIEPQSLLGRPWRALARDPV